MRVYYRESRFNNDIWVPHYFLCNVGKYNYYAAFSEDGESAWLDEGPASSYDPADDFEPSQKQRHIVIWQVFYKLKGMIDN